MEKIRAALLDERGVFMRIDELEDESQLTERHLPKITACDRPPGEYRWEKEEGNPYGGKFVPLPRAQRAQAGRPTIEQAVAFDWLAKWKSPPGKGQEPLEIQLAWLDDMVLSVDFGPFLKVPLVAEYIVARGLSLEKKD